MGGLQHAASEAAIQLRRIGWEHGICIVSEEAFAPYHRPPLSKGFLTDSVEHEKLKLKKDDIYKKNNISLKLDTEIVEIDRSEKCVKTRSGECIAYSELIIATGARPRKLNAPRFSLSCIHYLRTLSDAEKIKDNVQSGAKVLIIGAGYIGLEVAASAKKLGAMVTVVEAQNRILARVTSDFVSNFFTDLHRKEGVDVVLDTSIETIEEQGDCFIAKFNNNAAVEFDMMVVGIGVLPNTELAARCGLQCDNGIVVDEHTQTSDPAIYAIGDCSNHPSHHYKKRIRLESVPNAMGQAKVAASMITGTVASHQSLPWFWSDQFDVKIQTAGLFEGYEKTVIRGNPKDKSFCVFYLIDDCIIAMDAINSPADFMASKAFIANKTPVSVEKLSNTAAPWFK